MAIMPCLATSLVNYIEITLISSSVGSATSLTIALLIVTLCVIKILNVIDSFLYEKRCVCVLATVNCREDRKHLKIAVPSWNFQ